MPEFIRVEIWKKYADAKADIYTWRNSILHIIRDSSRKSGTLHFEVALPQCVHKHASRGCRRGR